jgi:hypothetical protein
MNAGRPEIAKECGSKNNSLSKCRNKKFIRTKTHLLALLSEKLRGFEHGL